MTKQEKKKHCSCCENNFYNGNNNLGVKECWSLDSAKLMKRKKVGINDVPPWDWEPELFLSCYERRGYNFHNCDKRNVVR